MVRPSGDAQQVGGVGAGTILGLTIARHFLELDALAGASEQDIARVAGRLIMGDPSEGPHESMRRGEGP